MSGIPQAFREELLLSLCQNVIGRMVFHLRVAAALPLMTLLLLAQIIQGFNPMGTIATVWSGNNDPLKRVPGFFSICVLQATVLQIDCMGSSDAITFPPPDTQEFFALSGGGFLTCGLNYGSHLVSCWGSGNLTVPDNIRQVSYTNVATGADHVCALRGDDSNIDCWGNIAQSPPKLAFASLVSGWGYSCALTREGAAICWGRLAQDIPQPSNETFSAIFAGALNVCGMTSSGNVCCWGSNDHRQSSPPNIGSTFMAIAGGLHHICGIRATDRHVVCWGSNDYGQLASPAGVPFSTIAAGDFYTCGVRLDVHAMQVMCWGNSVVYPSGVKFNVSPAPCVSLCGRDEYQFDKLNLPCPVLKDRVCLECSSCSKLDQEIYPCSPLANRVCGNASAFSLHHRGYQHRLRRIASMSLISVASVLVVLSILLWICIYFQRRQAKEFTDVAIAKPDQLVVVTRNDNDVSATRVIAMSPLELEIATSCYSDEMILGKGAFGTVYKGVLEDGQAVAIKRVSANTRSHDLFDKELQLLARTHHSRLVNLVGYCMEEKLLVFEFMARGSLYDNLFLGAHPHIGLAWVCRIKIAAQAARGLEYLHKYANPIIIHRDIKSANILLDDDWNAHVSDFGLSLFGPLGSASHLSNMTIVGTPGYLDPEYGLSMKLTAKSDVYSFGIVLLELLSGEKPVDPFRPARHIVSWAIELMESDALQAVLDSALEVPVPSAPLCRAVELALDCTKISAKDRPSMTEVAKTLEEIFEELQHTHITSSDSNRTQT